MVQNVGDMWQSATNPGAGNWVPADGRAYGRVACPTFRSLFGTRGLSFPKWFAVPKARGWWVCLVANAGATPPGGVTVKNAPSVPSNPRVFANAPANGPAGNVVVIAFCDPEIPMECAIVTGGVAGLYQPMTYQQSTLDYHATVAGVAAGDHQARVRPINSVVNEYTTGTFTLT